MLHATETGISSTLMGHLACMQTFKSLINCPKPIHNFSSFLDYHLRFVTDLPMLVLLLPPV